ncbi:MAG: ComF family protein [Bacteroidales bacterium]|nr:ComF family protein [Bacteroidales bacterium]
MVYFYDLIDDFLSLLFPRICYGCGEHLLRNEKLICTNCYVSIPRTDFHLREDNPVSRLFWGRCKIEKAAAFSYYTKGSRIRNIIHAIKYDGVRELGEEMGKIYGEVLSENGFFEGIDILIPVPLHPARQRKRGFNQSELICNGISKVTEIPINTSVLKRISFSGTQTSRSRYDRWLNVGGIFGINDAESLSLKGKHILLVDDVITTGSTVESCVDELLKIEDSRVSVIALGYTTI